MEEKDNIKVSIVMPTYNRAGTLGMAIESVLKQTFQDWELIIVDNESTDNTEDIVKKYSEKDKRIQYCFVKKSSNKGISDYLNYGISIADGKYIARLDDDDEWYDPAKLTKQVNFLEQNRDYILVGGGAVMVDGNRKEIFKFYKRNKDEEIRRHALLANPFWHNTVMFRKEEALKLGGYRNYRFVEDWDLWLRFGQVGRLYNFKEYFSLYMNAGQNLSVGNQKLAAKTILRLIKAYRSKYPNYKKAFIINFLQYMFAFLPSFIKKRVQNFLFFIKRNYL
ncbi:MAG: glycosyltransferase [Bacteroidetes bacterium]|nr:glycosyltransferase [Bacteroidota bacterium]